jgi:hypothetical protein
VVGLPAGLPAVAEKAEADEAKEAGVEAEEEPLQRLHTAPTMYTKFLLVSATLLGTADTQPPNIRRQRENTTTPRLRRS